MSYKLTSQKRTWLLGAENYLIGLVVTEKNIDKEAFKTTMQNVWKPKGRIQFKEVGDNLFIIEFQHEQDNQKVKKGRPWTFDHNLLCLNNFDGFSTPKDISFSKESMWIQLHNIPLG